VIRFEQNGRTTTADQPTTAKQKESRQPSHKPECKGTLASELSHGARSTRFCGLIKSMATTTTTTTIRSSGSSSNAIVSVALLALLLVAAAAATASSTTAAFAVAGGAFVGSNVGGGRRRRNERRTTSWSSSGTAAAAVEGRLRLVRPLQHHQQQQQQVVTDFAGLDDAGLDDATTATASTVVGLRPQKETTTAAAASAAASLALAATVVLASWSLSPAVASADYDKVATPSVVDTTTLQDVVRQLDQASTVQEAYDAYKSVSEVITEGKGVGGEVNYRGIQLDRGYVADEDTSVYNPGLTLLTESEKELLVDRVIEARHRVVVGSGGKNSDKVLEEWNASKAQDAFQYLKDKLDPLFVVELKPYLKIFPIWGAAVYLAVLAVQQSARELFPIAYLSKYGAYDVHADCLSVCTALAVVWYCEDFCPSSIVRSIACSPTLLPSFLLLSHVFPVGIGAVFGPAAILLLRGIPY